MEYADRCLRFRPTPPDSGILRRLLTRPIPSSTMRLAMVPYVFILLCMVLRGLQLVFALVAMITAAMSFPTITMSTDQVYRLGSAESTFTLLVAYTIIEYSGAFLLLVELFPMILRPKVKFTRIVDTLLAVLALTSGLVLAASDYVEDCDNYADSLHCTNLKASYIFVILCMVPLVGSILLTFVNSEDSEIECRDRAGSYRLVATPASTLSPIDNRGVVTA